MKRIFLLLLICGMSFYSFSCANSYDTDDGASTRGVASITYEPAEKKQEVQKQVVDIREMEDNVIGEADDVEIDYLYEMQGHWIRAEGYEAKYSEPYSAILVDYEKRCWTPYFDGVAGQSFACTGDLDGLHLSDAEGNIISYSFDGTALLDSEGNIAFVRTEEIPQ